MKTLNKAGLKPSLHSTQKTWLKPFSCALILATSQLAHAQICKTDSIIATTPDSRFTPIGNGAEVKDKVTGLIWQRCSIGQTWDGNTCTGNATSHTWQQALTVAKNLGKGYRLPNIKELASIVEEQCYDPAINSKTFPNTPSNWYWSSSPNAYYNGNAWGVYFHDGNDGDPYKNGSSYVRAVR